MPSTQPGGIEEELWEMESDLPSLANQAALELDNQLLRRGTGFEAVKRLATRLTSDGITGQGPIYPTGGYDPITIGAVSRAIDELIPNAAKRPEKLSEALELAAEKTKRLTQVAKDPNSVRPQDLEELRQYCLALSESASQSEWPPDENDPRHRFGR